MKLDKGLLILGIVFAFAYVLNAWALTVDQIWQDIYDSSNHSIRVTVVP